MYGIFRGVYFGEYETENYKFGLVQLAVTPASFSVLKHCAKTTHFKFQFLLGAAVLYFTWLPLLLLWITYVLLPKPKLIYL